MRMNVAFLWHMHQPHYVDSVCGTMLMPWVRLHATKGYLDMIWLAEQYPEFRCTFNLTPVLLRQIEQLANNEVRDLWYELASTPAEELTAEQKHALLEHYFKANWDNMIKPHRRYWSLLQKRGFKVSHAELPHIADGFSEQEFRDLQVWLHLAWFGYAAQRLLPEIVELKQKGREFSEADKQILFRCQEQVLRTVIGRYKAAADIGQIEVCTSPFYHPILPLLCDNEFARRSMPGCRLPPPFTHPEDARAQLELARDYHTKLFGTPPRGVWPSEGSVCPELVPMLQELGFEWFASDEEILWRSLPNGETPDRNFLYQGFQVEQGSSKAIAAFRDRSLSDFIGFTAARNPPRQAADLLVQQIEQVARSQSRSSNAICSIILDGENAWEHFPDGGETFLRSLYERLSAHPGLQTTTFGQYFQSHPPQATLQGIYTGSWINADFHIWISDLEDNRAWQLLGETRDFLKAQTVTPAIVQKAMDEIYAAEGSDWFWWYGDQFATEDDLLFDELFRTHLQNVYQLLGVPIPSTLKTYICRSELHRETRNPTDLITPVIDGQVTSFYEWDGAGLYAPSRAMSAMYRSERVVEVVYFGCDLAKFYLRVDFQTKSKRPSNLVLRVNFIQPAHCTLDVSPLERGQCKAVLIDTSDTKRSSEVQGVALQEILEVQIPFAKLGWRPTQQVGFFLQLLGDGVELERHPQGEPLMIVIPDEDFKSANWQV